MAGNTSDVEGQSTPWLVERQTNSRLLIDEEPLQVLPSLASKIGLNEALFLQQLHYWLRKSTHQHQGRRWIYNSYPQWHEQLPFWSEHTIRRIVEALKRRGLIDTANFNRVQSDRTMWYSINYEAVAVLHTSPPVSPPSGATASSYVQVGQMDCPDWPDEVSKLDTFPEKDLRKGSTETEEGERTRTRDVHVVPPVQESRPRPSPPPSRRMPADYTPSTTLKAELEERYPMLDFEEELYKMQNCEFPTPKRDWDATTRMWFSREAQRRPVATGPSQGTGGDWHTTVTTDKRTRELERQRQVALTNFHAAQEQQQAITVVYEDITHGAERLPGISGLVDRSGGMLLHRATTGPSRPAVLCRPHTL